MTLNEQLTDARNKMTVHQITTEPLGYPCPACQKMAEGIRQLEAEIAKEENHDSALLDANVVVSELLPAG